MEQNDSGRRKRHHDALRAVAKLKRKTNAWVCALPKEERRAAFKEVRALGLVPEAGKCKQADPSGNEARGSTTKAANGAQNSNDVEAIAPKSRTNSRVMNIVKDSER